MNNASPTNMDHLILVSLGPIQDFIASARRCQDLWFGSWLLSDLARATAESIETNCGDKALIFPGSLDVGDQEAQQPSVANKILAIVPHGQDFAAIARSAELAMRDRLHTLADFAFDRLPNDQYFDDRLRNIANRQVNDLMEFVWVAVPVAAGVSSSSEYAGARDRAERLLAARKNLRTWSQVEPSQEGGWGDAVPKSSLDGHRESVLHEYLYDALRKRPHAGYPVLTTQRARERYFVRKQERLCGVGLLKRVGSEADADFDGASGGIRRPVFHSTSHVAAAPIRSRAASMGAPALAALDTYAQVVFGELNHDAKRRLTLARAARRGAPIRNPLGGPDAAPVATPVAFGHDGFDGRLLYAGQLGALIEDYGRQGDQGGASGAVDAEALKTVTQALGSLLGHLGLSNDGVPAYYATLLADGDAMGEALDVVGKIAGVEGHRKVSAALDVFARSCRTIVERHGGSLVYSGGDDVLALLPLHTVLSCARELHDVFGKAMSDTLRQLQVTCRVPTLSVGLGIGHHLEDMADVRALAHRAEKSAKAFPGKNALAIHVQMRSGGSLEAVGSFAAELPVDRRVLDWARFQLDGAIPGKAAHDLDAEMGVLLRGKNQQELAGVALSLATRVLDRKRGQHGSEALSAEIRTRVSEYLQGDAPQGGKDVVAAVHALAQELQIARLIAGAVDVAFPRMEANGGTK